jgi:hypothetical protein
MEMPFEGAQRTHWKTNDKTLFFRRLLSLFPQIEPEDLITIEENLYNPLAYFEVAHYDDSISEEDPSIILIIDKGEIYLDFMHPFRMTRQKNLLEMLLQKTGKMVAKRELTQKDFQERLEVLSESSPI